MRDNRNNYLSEFEQEFEFNDESMRDYAENEIDSSESDYEFSDEYELEGENDTELESEVVDSESESWGDEYDSRESEFEERLYAALSGEFEDSFEMEQEIDRVLYEMEVEYFWKAAKGLWNKHKKKIMGVAGKFLPQGTLQSLAKLAGGDLRSLLKSDLFKKGLSLAANTFAPGVGGVVAGRLLSGETPAANDVRAQAQQAVQTARAAYQNMARQMTGLRPGNLNSQIAQMSRQALTAARQNRSAYRGKRKRVIQTSPGSIVVVRPDRVIIYS